MAHDRKAVQRALARLGYTKAAVDMDRWGMATCSFLKAIGADIRRNAQGKPVLWIKEGPLYRRTVIR